MRSPLATLMRSSSQLLLIYILTSLPLAAASSPLERHNADIRQDQAIGQRMALEAPVAVRKMSDDPGEKFYPEYWQFNTRDGSTAVVQFDIPFPMRRAEVVDGQEQNTSLAIRHLPPLLQHRDSPDTYEAYGALSFLPRNLFAKRGYQCPSGTNDCASIGYANVCCGTNEKCMKITNSGLGPVGCCPDGETCSGSVSSCDTAQGYTGCPNSSDGGCCIPGFQCNSIGCVAGSTSTVTTTAAATTVVASSSSQISSTQSQSDPSVATTTVVETVSPPTGQVTVYETVTTPTGTTTIGQVSINAVSTATTVVYSTLSNVSPAVRPTSDAGGYCPTGYYPCSAVYNGGCCQNGRSCHTTTCPPAYATGLITSDSVVTILVETGVGQVTVSAEAAPTSVASSSMTGTTTTTSGASVVTVLSVMAGSGTCATGWFSCAASVGGGCCPSGYGCSSYCSATVKGFPGKVNKVPPLANAAANVDGLGKFMVALAGIAFAGMLVL